MTFRLAARARRDIQAALDYSRSTYGQDAAVRYELLLFTAIEQIVRDPNGGGSRPVQRNTDIRAYAISLSRKLTPSDRRVRKPAHTLVYSLSQDGTVLILAVVGDSYPAIHPP